MGMSDSILVNLIQKVRSWISWGNSDSNSISSGFKITDKNCEARCHCEEKALNSCIKYHCQSCGRLLCGKCVHGVASFDVASPSLKKTMEAVVNIKTCNLCFELGPITNRKCSGKVYPSESLRHSSEPPSSSNSSERFEGHSPRALTRTTEESFSDNLSPVYVHRSSSRSDEDDGEDSTNNFCDMSSEYLHYTFDIESDYLSARDEFNSFMSLGSSPSDSPSRNHFISDKVGHSVQREQGRTSSSQNDGSFDHEQAVLEKPAEGTWDPEKVDDLSFFQKKDVQLPGPLNSVKYDLIWIPPLPHNVADEEENSFVTFEDEDDEVGDSSEMLSPNADLDCMLFSKEKPHMDHKEPSRAVVQGYFRSLVFQLLQGQGIISAEENCAEDWLNIITEVAWKAANFIKPDTGGGGSMDPCDYVKVKCVASGRPSDSELIKGVVCTKNIKHKRMISQYRNSRLLLLGGSLEYQRDPEQLASFDALLQQEKNHLKMIVSKIEARRPNVLLVEKSVSSFALEQLLAKEISLVLNVKRPLLERIARCSGATITPSTDHIPRAMLGHCELFHLQKITEDHEPVNNLNRRPSKTLMFFEGCPRRLGCTVLLRGSSVEELKKVKNVVQYAVFAAYHLSLETSFLADEGAALPKIGASSHNNPEKTTLDKVTSVPDSVGTTSFSEEFDVHLEHGLQDSLSELSEVYDNVSVPDEFGYRKALSDACDENLALNGTHNPMESHSGDVSEVAAAEKAGDAFEYYSANDNSESILVSFSSHCILNGTVCERSRLLRVKFYGSSDKPLGRYIREDLFNESFCCRSCNKSTEAHAVCYTHQSGNLMISVRRLPSFRLHGERDGKIWMWHRCLRCTHIEGVPPATPRVVMSDSAWGLSFGKFLELSFSNHATGNRVATCGHSLQRDCLRFYGFGNMIACFQYSPISILSVRLPPAILEFCGLGEQSWINKETLELLRKAKTLYAEISAVLQEINHRSLSFMHDFCDANDLHRRVLELNDMLANEQNYLKDLLGLLENNEDQEQNQAEFDILEINRLRRSLLISSRVWDRRLYLLDSLLRTRSSPKALNDVEAPTYPKDEEEYPALLSSNKEPKSEPSVQDDYILPTCPRKEWDEVLQYEGDAANFTSLERRPSAASILSDKIDSAWCGAGQAPDGEISEIISTSQINQKESSYFRRLLSRTRLHSFDSAQMIQERTSKDGFPSLHLSKLRSFHGDYKYMPRSPVSNVQRSCSVSQHEAEKLSVSLISFPSLLPEGARLMVPQNGQHDIVLTVYDNEPTSIVSYALTSKEYVDWISDKQNDPKSGSNSKVNSIASDLSTWQSVGSMDLDYMHFTNYTPVDASPTVVTPHLRISFEDDSTISGKMKFQVTCYFAKQFDLLRRKCCPNELDFVRSLSRCRTWSAQGGKSNVYFAKSFDERFIIKQVTKTELESFQEFSSEYFKYLTDALTSQSPTCLAKILGLYQVVVKPSKGGKETKMDFMVMENLFFRKNISKVYDLKGSSRSRYNPDTTGVLLDSNLLETLCTKPLFLGSKAKRTLERAVWNDTSFLACVDVMDYSLLVGVDETGKELVLGIIDYLRQYTWDKHLETWVKASGILGGPKNAAPTIISPKQYKKRFRKAMTTYFLTLPDQWSASS
ncbi:hypothetical protein ACS0TY_008446 [Phlomoides rotata]